MNLPGVPWPEQEELSRGSGSKPGSDGTLVDMVPRPGSALQEGALSTLLGQHGAHWGGAPQGASRPSLLGKGGFSSWGGGLGKAEEHAHSPGQARVPEPSLGTR